MSVFFSATFVHDGLLLLLLLSSASFLEMKAAADAFVCESPPAALAPPESTFTFASFLPTFTTTVMGCPVVTLLVTSGPLFISILVVTVFFSSSLVVLSDWKNLSLSCSVLAAVVEVRGVGVGLVLTGVVVVVKVDS